jgi:AcrR family transcriptional regulator
MKSPAPRGYASPLRESQAAQTRQRIIAAAIALIENGIENLTVPMVAVEAQVALRTVFRHFPTREELLDATWNALNAQLGEIPDLDGLDGLAAFIPELFQRYDSLEGQIRAVIFSNLLQGSRRRRGSERARKLRRTIDALTEAGSDARGRAMVRAIAYVLTVPNVMIFLKDTYGLSASEAGQASAWAIRTLLGGYPANHPNSKPAATSKGKPK